MPGRKLEPHPLIGFLEPAASDPDSPVRVLRVERRDLKGSSIWAGPYLAFAVDPGQSMPNGFPISDHTDVGWAIGNVVWEWFQAHGIPCEPAAVTRALFSVEDFALQQELKCWFRVDMTNGRAFARPIVDGLDATSPGDYCSVNDYLMTLPQYRKGAPLSLRLTAILVPENRCPASARELTLRGDLGQELKYTETADGTLKKTGHTGAGGDGPTLDEIFDIARKKQQQGEG